MAKLNQGILGGISGTIGNVVGSSWKGINVIKSKPLSVANPRTASQVAQRGKMSNAVAFASVINTTIIKPLWDRFASKMSGYNDFISTNIALFTAAVPEPPVNLVLSKGKMSATEMDDATASTAGAMVQVAFTDDSGEGYKLATDELYIVAMNEDTEEIGFAAGDQTRADEYGQVTLPSTPSEGDNISIWTAFRRADGTIVSDSDYILTATVAG